MGEIAERVQGNDGRMDLPTLTISAANGWMDQKERFSGNIAGKEQKKYTLLHKGELSYNHGNSKLAKYGTVFSLETYEEALVPRVYHSFKVINGSSKFIEYYFATKIPDRELAKLVSSGARMDGLLNINFNEFMGINLTVPNKSEQEKISNYFSNLDHLITLHQRKLFEAKNNSKNGSKKFFRKIYQKLYKFDFNFKTYDWEQRKLGEFADIVTGKLDANAMKEDGEYDFYTSGIQKYKIDVPAFEGPAITIAGNGATVGYMHLADGKFNAYQRTYVLSAFQANRKFLFYEIGNKLPQKIAQEARTGNIPYIVMDMLTDLQIFIPPEHEQSKIGEFFSNLDHLITLHQREVFYTLKHIFYRCCDTLLSGGL